MMTLKKVNWNEIKEVCDKFYTNNKYMTPYQSWDFLNIVGKGFQLKRPFENLSLRLDTYALYDDNTIICIIPLAINHSKKTLHMRGYISSIGHLDFIYPDTFTQENFDEMIQLLKKEFSGYTFVFDRISEKSLTYKYAKPHYEDLMVISECISIPLEKTWDDWFTNRIGTKKRNLLRRSYKRLEEDKYNVHVEIYNKENIIETKVWKRICQLFAKRSCIHNNLNVRIFEPLAYLIKKNDPIGKSLHDGKYSMIMCLFFNDELAAFGCGVKSNDGRFICMRHAVDMKFKPYGVGLVYTSEILKKLISISDVSGIKEFDRSRGIEEHKQGVGGIIHNNYNWNLKL